MSAGSSLDATEMTQLQRMVRVLPPLCNLCIAAAVNANAD